jgi:hypothetical protein
MRSSAGTLDDVALLSGVLGARVRPAGLGRGGR